MIFRKVHLLWSIDLPPMSLAHIFLLLLSFGASALLGSAKKCGSHSAHDFLKTDAPGIRNKHGKGSIVTLHGINLGGWLLMESWMTPMGDGIVDDIQLRDVLSNRFGQLEMEKLIDVYQSSWIRTNDLDNIQEAVNSANDILKSALSDPSGSKQ